MRGNWQIESIKKQQSYICIQNDPIGKIFPKDTLNIMYKAISRIRITFLEKCGYKKDIIMANAFQKHIYS